MKKYVFISIISIIFTILNINNSFGNNDEICKISINASNTIRRNEMLEIKLNVNEIDNQEGISAIDGVLEYDNEIFENIIYEKNNEWSNFYQLNNVLFFVTDSMEEKFKDTNLLNIKLKVKENAKIGETKIKFSKIEAVGSSNILKTVSDVEKNIEIKDLISQDNDHSGNQNTNVNNNDKFIDNQINNPKQDSNESKDSTQNNSENNLQNKEDNQQQKDEENKLSKTPAKTGKVEQNSSLADKILSKTGLGITSLILTIILISIGIIFYIKYKKIK